jgi:hypothetical protein
VRNVFGIGGLSVVIPSLHEASNYGAQLRT